MDWAIGTNLGTEILNHSGAIDGYTSFVEFIPTKQTGLVVLCSCDEKDVQKNWKGVVETSLLHSSGIIH
jgi:hypothetical protein